MNERKRNIRKLLTGYLHDDGTVIVPAEKIWQVTYHGTFTGSASARVFGIFSRTRTYRLKEKTALVRETCAKTFMQMGRRASVEEDPEELTVLCFPVLHNPCLLSAHVDGNTVTLDFCAARTIRAFLNARRAFRQWEKLLPEGIAERVKQENQDPKNKKQKTNTTNHQQKKGRRDS